MSWRVSHEEEEEWCLLLMRLDDERVTTAAPLDGRPRELVGFGFLGTVPKLVGMCGPLVAILGEGSSASAQATDGFYAVRARLEVKGSDDSLSRRRRVVQGQGGLPCCFDHASSLCKGKEWLRSFDGAVSHKGGVKVVVASLGS